MFLLVFDLWLTRLTRLTTFEKRLTRLTKHCFLVDQWSTPMDARKTCFLLVFLKFWSTALKYTNSNTLQHFAIKRLTS